MIEPPQTPWLFADGAELPPEDLVAIGADLAPGTLLAAYRRGLFPMPSGPVLEGTGLILDGGAEPPAWFCPLERGVLPLDGLRVTRSMRASAKRFRVTVDAAFEDVLDCCADPAREHGWIDDSIRSAYVELHRLGWAHSVEVWRAGELAGGLYGVQIGGLFAGESMFHRDRDASKVALMALVDRLRGPDEQQRLLDVQWSTPHLASLGVVEVPRTEYLSRLRAALLLPPRLP